MDLEYPKDLPEEHNSYEMAPEIKTVEEEWMSEYQRNLMREMNLEGHKSEKLVLTLHDKKNYVSHYRNQQFYLKQEMLLKKVNRALEFEQE